ncbi:MAG: methionine--tRNA ligase [Candidatus Aenigmarchaeota archaeon]|nr:methionine--tRNA ligase [Candidatus Aenigmarchaeota archaeon]
MIEIKFYITTAIDYVNAKPHMGHAYEKIIADFLARWHRIRGHDVFFLTGTDENAQKNVKAAEEAGMSIKEFVDKNAERFKDLCRKLDISYDYFIRTTEERHKKIVQRVFQKMYENGDIYKGKYRGLYCYGCEKFLTEKELVNGKCPIHNREPELIEEDAYFFKMSKYKDKIVEFLKSGSVIPEGRAKEVLNRIGSDGLKDLCVSRASVDWGVEIPFDKNYRIYVWVDALINYISALDYPDGENFNRFWPVDVHIIGKDINWFHSVIWPSILMSIGTELPENILVHGFVNIGGQKMSKSSGLVVDPIKLIEKYGANALRYFLLREIPMGQDGDFSEYGLVERHNNELADTFGNFAHRTLTFIKNKFNGKIPNGEVDKDLDIGIRKKIDKIESLWDEFKIREGLEEVLAIAKIGNEYFQKNQPWKAIKESPDRAENCIYNCANILKKLTILFYPVIPSVCKNLSEKINIEINWDELNEPIKPSRIKTPEILFKKLEVFQEDPLSSLDLRVAKILEVKDHPNADKLYVLKIDCGDERQIISGLKDYYTKEELMGKKIIVVANLEPAVFRGEESNGMLLAGEDKNGDIGLLFVKDSKPGERIFVEGIKYDPKEIVSIKEFRKVKMFTGSDCVWYKGEKLKTESGEVVGVERVGEGARVT